MTAAVDIADITEYRELQLAVEPRTVISEAQAETYREVIDALTDRRDLSEGQREMAGLLGQVDHPDRF